MRPTTETRSQRDAPARPLLTAQATPAQRPSTGLTPAEIRQIVLDILG
ncbi:hypothetical protein [Neoroseomonas oryzicola]|uniref:Uncharacterized protein n=1 Tax=Neoroseomonas oryzicola TaxID=535904 RepID=A0A9X9WFA8_9PROT|nr:hypothetical protein [Neoroseomonas oryzicola]MBR0659018.1 hypothetical protein [Neoroseomonas oryzicola]NKE16955.1 hypothetical protein [Neoroseomonas oryzicola]